MIQEGGEIVPGKDGRPLTLLGEAVATSVRKALATESPQDEEEHIFKVNQAGNPKGKELWTKTGTYDNKTANGGFGGPGSAPNGFYGYEEQNADGTKGLVEADAGEMGKQIHPGYYIGPNKDGTFKWGDEIDFYH